MAHPRHPSRVRRRRRPARRLPLVLAAAAVVVALLFAAGAALSIYRTSRAARAGVEGKAALLRAEDLLADQRLPDARLELNRAEDAFARMRGELRSMGPFLPLARVTPFVRIQVRGVEAFADAGQLLSAGGLELIDAAALVLEPADPNVSFAAGVNALQTIAASLDTGVTRLDAAVERVRTLDGYRLVASLEQARRDLLDRLPEIRERAVRARDGAAALAAFLGTTTPRRYLVVSQNPDEPRPTGGFIGTYGVLETRGGRLELERYEGIEDWYRDRPQAVVPPDQAPTVFQVQEEPLPQTIANANAEAGWPGAARLAMELWERGGEQPVDGVISITPDFLAGVLAVLGPVTVPDYGETITAANLVERVDFYTHSEAREPDPLGRKAFVAALAEVVLQRLLAAPAERWVDLARAAVEGFDRGEALAHATDERVAREVGARGWDGALPATLGDFFFDAEFSFAAKNGRGIRRTFDHHVTLRDDGSARVATAITIRNTLVTDTAGLINTGTLSYLTIYGPAGARLTAGSDEQGFFEEPLSGHPAFGWFRDAPPLGETTLTVVWEVPSLLLQRGDGALEYRLLFKRIPAHRGDVLHLTVDPPPGWQWAGDPPPAEVTLDDDFTGAWVLVPAA